LRRRRRRRPEGRLSGKGAWGELGVWESARRAMDGMVNRHDRIKGFVVQYDVMSV